MFSGLKQGLGQSKHRLFCSFFMIFIMMHLLELSAKSSRSPSVLRVYTYDSMIGKESSLGEIIRNKFEAFCSCRIVFVPMASQTQLKQRVLREGKRLSADVILGFDYRDLSELKPLLASHGLSYDSSTFAEESMFLSADIYEQVSSAYALPFEFSYFALNYRIKPFHGARSLDLSEYLDQIRTTYQNTGEKHRIILISPDMSTLGLGFLSSLEEAAKKENKTLLAYWEQHIAPFFSLRVAPNWSVAYPQFQQGRVDSVLSYTTSPLYHEEVEKSTDYSYVHQPQGHYIQVNLMGVAANAQEPELAQDFLEFIRTHHIQTEIPESNWMYPVYVSPQDLPTAFQNQALPKKGLLPKLGPGGTQEEHKLRRDWSTIILQNRS